MRHIRAIGFVLAVAIAVVGGLRLVDIGLQRLDPPIRVCEASLDDYQGWVVTCHMEAP